MRMGTSTRRGPFVLEVLPGSSGRWKGLKWMSRHRSMSVRMRAKVSARAFPAPPTLVRTSSAGSPWPRSKGSAGVNKRVGWGGLASEASQSKPSAGERSICSKENK